MVQFTWGKVNNISSKGERHPKSIIEGPNKSMVPYFQKTNTVSDANKICNHIFNFLGTGDVYWGEKINWNVDMKSSFKWDIKFYNAYMQEELLSMHNVDIKNPWEINRLQHLVVLGQAWKISKDKKYLKEISLQLNHWIDSNPFCYGINWTSTMEVSIRAINVIITMDLISDTNVWKNNYKAIEKLLIQHGRFISYNLEIGVLNGQISAGNHYLANLSALAIIGMVWDYFDESDQWRSAAMIGLDDAMKFMVLEDGFFFESSTSYHRFALELFLFPYIFGKKLGHEFSRNYVSKIEKMLEIIFYISGPRNHIPQVGDNDDGRLLILSEYGNWAKDNFSYLLGIGGFLFDRDDFRGSCELQPEELFWIYNHNEFENKAPLKNIRKSSKSLFDSGLFVIKNEPTQDYALIKLGVPKKHAPKGHSHNDILSLSLYSKGQSVFIDRGTYCYTFDAKIRNLYRSSFSHNILTINNLEINEIAEEIFNLDWDLNSVCKEWKITDDKIIFVGEHDGYKKRLNVIVRRTVIYNIPDSEWLITDEVEGKLKNIEYISTNWILNPNLNFQIKNSIDDEVTTLHDKSNNINLDFIGHSDIHIQNSDYSPSYGIKLSTNIIYTNINNKNGKYRAQLRVS